MNTWSRSWIAGISCPVRVGALGAGPRGHAEPQGLRKPICPQDWARTQNNLGQALADQGRRSEGATTAELFDQAVAAYRSALEVRTREQLPQDWAQTEQNLGQALYYQGRQSEGAKGAKMLNQAVAAYRSAPEVYTREQLPQEWATTQNSLGNALSDLGTRSGG